MALTQSDLMSPDGAVMASQFNFIDEYTYAQQYEPETLPDVHLAFGKGKITKFCSLMSSESDYAADQVKHSELGRLHQVSENVSVTGSTFTCPLPHNLRVNETIVISDGVKNKYAVVSSKTSETVFEVENAESGAFDFAGNVTLFAYGNTWGKGTGNFTTGKDWNPKVYTNNTHILKGIYKTSESDMAQISWVKAPQFEGGWGWTAVGMSRTRDEHDNYIELTHLMNVQLADDSPAFLAGKPKGMKGLIPQIKERGVIGGEYIKTIDDLNEYALKAKQNGGCTVFTIWGDHQQMIYFNEIASSLNASFANGANYGAFANSKDMAVMLDFGTICTTGVTFHFTPYTLLDDPSLFGASNFLTTAPACLIVPAGMTKVKEDGDTYDKPYLNIRYRRKAGINKYRETKIFGGPIGTPHKQSTMEVHIETEQTNQVIGGNLYGYVGRGTF